MMRGMRRKCGGGAWLCIAQVPRGLSEDEISPVFKVFGNIVEIHVLRDKHTGQAKGSAFVKFATMEEARNCIATLDGTAAFPDYSDKIVEVRLANGEESRLGERRDQAAPALWVIDNVHWCRPPAVRREAADYHDQRRNPRRLLRVRHDRGNQREAAGRERRRRRRRHRGEWVG